MEYTNTDKCKETTPPSDAPMSADITNKADLGIYEGGLLDGENTTSDAHLNTAGTVHPINFQDQILATVGKMTEGQEDQRKIITVANDNENIIEQSLLEDNELSNERFEEKRVASPNFSMLKEKRKKKLAERNGNTNVKNNGNKSLDNFQLRRDKKRKVVDSQNALEPSNKTKKTSNDFDELKETNKLFASGYDDKQSIAKSAQDGDIKGKKDLVNIRAHEESRMSEMENSCNNHITENDTLLTSNTEIVVKNKANSNDNQMEDNYCIEDTKVAHLSQDSSLVDDAIISDQSNDDENEERTEVPDSIDGESTIFQDDDKLDQEGEESYDDDYGNDLDDNELHAWLEEGISEKKREKCTMNLKDGEYISQEKIVLEEIGSNPFEVLPEGWVMVTHYSGMPVFLHKQSRVCTFSRPYFIGSGSLRKHDIPVSAVPCLHYRRQKEKQTNPNECAEITENGNGDGELGGTSGTDGIPKATIQSRDMMEKQVSLSSEDLYQYCKELFNFKRIIVKKFKTWREKRAHLLDEKKKKDNQVPTLSANMKLITCPITSDTTSAKKSRKKEFVINPDGKTAVCILHEYTQNVLRVQPSYIFKEIENAETPFKATVVINGIQYGSGVAAGKRLAKNEAAKATLEIFVPSLSSIWDDSTAKTSYKDEQNSDLSYFEEVSIEDPRVTALCDKAALPKPYQVLHECLRRNFGLGDTDVHIDRKLVSNQKTEFTLSIGKHTCTVTCKNKLEGKQRASQAMLQLLHPNLTNWAAILRLYRKSTEMAFKERQEEEIPVPEDVGKQKNFEILKKLKESMRKVQEERKQQLKTQLQNLTTNSSSVLSTVPALDL